MTNKFDINDMNAKVFDDVGVWKKDRFSTLLNELKKGHGVVIREDFTRIRAGAIVDSGGELFYIRVNLNDKLRISKVVHEPFSEEFPIRRYIIPNSDNGARTALIVDSKIQLSRDVTALLEKSAFEIDPKTAARAFDPKASMDLNYLVLVERDRLNLANFSSNLTKFLDPNEAARIKNAIEPLLEDVGLNTDKINKLLNDQFKDVEIKDFDSATNHLASAGYLNLLKKIVENNPKGSISDFAVSSAARGGHLETVKYLIENKAKIPSFAVSSAAHGGHLEMVKYLVENKAEIDSFAVSSAAHGGHLETVKYLIENKAKIPSFAVKFAAEGGHLETVKYLVENKAEIPSHAVSSAAGGGHLETVKYLVKNKAEIHSIAVRNAAHGGHLETVKYLLENKDEIPSDVVNYAALGGHLETVKYLLENKAKIPFHAVCSAAGGGHLETVKYLVKNKAEIHSIAVRNAAHGGHLETVKYLVENKAEIHSFAVSDAAAGGHLETVKYLLENKAEIPYDAVSSAARGGHLETVKYLVENKAEISSDAIKYAARGGHLETVKYLVENKAEISSDAIKYATEGGHLETVKYLQSKYKPKIDSDAELYANYSILGYSAIAVAGLSALVAGKNALSNKTTLTKSTSCVWELNSIEMCSDSKNFPSLKEAMDSFSEACRGTWHSDRGCRKNGIICKKQNLNEVNIEFLVYAYPKNGPEKDMLKKFCDIK